VCWVFSLQARGFIDQITEESVVSLDASYGLLHLLEEGKGHSATWTVNHRVRFLTTTAIAAMDLSSAMNDSWHGAGRGVVMQVRVLDAVVAVGLFVVVLTTAAAPAVATDQLIKDLQLKLATLGRSNVGDRATLHQHATQIMQRADYLRGKVGMTFLGVSMTTGRAIRFASTLGTLAILIMRLR
jgi:hypothetical protein